MTTYFRTLLVAGAGTLGGLVVGAANPDKVEFYKTFLLPRTEAQKQKRVKTAQDLVDYAVSITERAGEFAILSTVNEEGGVCSRMIQPFPVEFDSIAGDPCIYFNTNLLSRKVKQMRANSQCTVTYVNPKEMAYVTWQGQVVQVEDKTVAKKHWKDWLLVFYPEGPDGHRFSTWTLRPHKIQVVSVTEGIVSGREDWQPPEVVKSPMGKWERVDTFNYK